MLIPIGYTALTVASLSYSGTLPAPPSLRPIVVVAGVALFAASSAAAARIHSLFPPRHDKPGDFEELLTTGPYALCRHPFYLALMANQLSIPLIFQSLQGTIVYLVLLPFWVLVIRVEEKELLEYWGEKYREYMRHVPMLIPRLRRRRG